MAKVDFKQAKVGAYWDPTGYESTWGKGIGEGWHTVQYHTVCFGKDAYISISAYLLRYIHPKALQN